MIHNLTTLKQRETKRHPELVSRFRLLEAYTQTADNNANPPQAMYLNYGFRSLKWLIYSLRDKLPRKELQMLYHALICEALARDMEEMMYANIFELDVGLHYAKQIPRPEFNIDDWPIININNRHALLNTTTQNITNLVFRDDFADMILVRSPKQHAAVILSRETAREVDLQPLYDALPSTEPWQRIGNNLLICAGPKFPDQKTGISMEELITLAEEYL